MMPESAFPELDNVWLQFTRFPYEGRFFKQVVVWLAKSIDLDVDEELRLRSFSQSL